jgi:sec-independent protein translocase protein TatB
MLDRGFSEILVIFVLALVVLGPEKLRRLASQIGRWIGRARGMAAKTSEGVRESSWHLVPTLQPAATPLVVSLEEDACRSQTETSRRPGVELTRRSDGPADNESAGDLNPSTTSSASRGTAVRVTA